MLKYTLLGLLLAACSDGPPHTPETRPVEHPNAGNTAIYDVDADDPYEMSDSSFLDLYPGMPLPATASLRPAGKQKAGSLTYDRYWLLGHRSDTLAYVLADPQTDTIASVHVTSADVVTRAGLRVTNTYAEIRERTGQATPLGPQPETNLILGSGWLQYRLATPIEGGAGAQSPDSRIAEIILRKP